jgi:NADH dehydrogenase
MIIVTGATGFIGRNVVKRLRSGGSHIRCILTQPKQGVFSESPNVEIVTSSLLDEERLFKAVTGAHTIIHLESAQWWGRTRDLERVELVGTRNLLAAARSARVGRIIAVSHLGASSASAYTLLRIKGVLEELIRSSGLAYTIIRSGIVFGEEDAFANHIAMMLKTSPLFVLMPGQGEVLLHPIYIADLVEALARSLELVDTVDTTLEIGGAEYITLEDLIRTIMRVTDIYRTIIPVPPYLLRWLTGAYSRVLPRTLVTSQWLDILATSRTAPLGNIFSYFGIHPRRIEDTLLTYLPQKSFLWSAIQYSLRRRQRGI